MKIHEVLKHNVAEVAVPYEVWRLFGDQQKAVTFAHEEVSLGEDYATLARCREAVAWYVDQLGGKVKWEK